MRALQTCVFVQFFHFQLRSSRSLWVPGVGATGRLSSPGTPALPGRSSSPRPAASRGGAAQVHASVEESSRYTVGPFRIVIRHFWTHQPSEETWAHCWTCLGDTARCEHPIQRRHTPRFQGAALRDVPRELVGAEEERLAAAVPAKITKITIFK